MKRNPKRINKVLASIVMVVLILGLFVALPMKIKSAKYDARVEMAYAQIQRAVSSDANYAKIEVSIGICSRPHPWLSLYRRTIGRVPAMRRLGLLDSAKPVKGIVITSWQGALDPGPFFDDIITPLNIGDVPVELH